MKLRQNMLDALQCRNDGPFVPTCEIAFFQLERFFEDPNPPRFEAIAAAQGKKRADLLRRLCTDMAEGIERLEHGLICAWNRDLRMESAEMLAQVADGRYATSVNIDSTLGLPRTGELAEFCFRIADEPDAVLAEQEAALEEAIAEARIAADHGVEVLWMGADYCFNQGPFLSPEMFAKFVTPFLQRQTAAFKDMGFITIKHTDGNIMPVLDQIFSAKPHALHSIDAQAGVDIAEVRRRAEPLGICVIGNVEHQYMETGTEDDLRRSAKYCLEHGGAGKPGYVYSTSNAINEYSRMDRYLLMQQIRHEKMRQLGYQGPEYPSQMLYEVSRGLDYY